MIRRAPGEATVARQIPHRTDRAMDVIQYGIAVLAIAVAALLAAVH